MLYLAGPGTDGSALDMRPRVCNLAAESASSRLTRCGESVEAGEIAGCCAQASTVHEDSEPAAQDAVSTHSSDHRSLSQRAHIIPETDAS